MCSIIPDGVVIFFPSYSYLTQVTQRWEKVPPGSVKLSIWQQLVQIKEVFRESKDNASVENILQEYSQCIDNGRGGLLLSVIGGKMSEGINFSDRLGRGVLVVGLPFPNANSAEWKAKLGFVEKTAYERALRTGKKDISEVQMKRDAKAAGRELYENACMRAVNQSIGRAIRHRGDYACIILLDKRYQGERVKGKLPAWIRKGLVASDDQRPFMDVIESLQLFFAAKEGANQ
jgi:chromosome transmission fidelity protein 1